MAFSNVYNRLSKKIRQLSKTSFLHKSGKLLCPRPVVGGVYLHILPLRVHNFRVFFSAFVVLMGPGADYSSNNGSE